MNLNRLKIVLAENNISQKEISLALGVGRVSVSRWCCNQVQPSLPDLKRMADFLNIPIRDFLVDYKPKQEA